jgi:anti-sigma-K factor RskA
MNCEELKDMFELYSLGLLDPEEKEEIDIHLGRGCQNCQKSLKEAVAVNSMLLSFPQQVAPPARLKRRVMASVGAQRASWTWLAALAAACMLVVALWLSVQERTRTAELADARRTLMQVSAERDRLTQALDFLHQPDTQQVNFGRGQPAPPRGNVLVNPRLGVLLIASNLPALAPGRTYQMWVIPKGVAPRPAGLFQSSSQGTAMHILSGSLDPSMLGAIAVSVEPEAGSTAPTTQPLIVAPIPGA